MEEVNAKSIKLLQKESHTTVTGRYLAVISTYKLLWLGRWEEGGGGFLPANIERLREYWSSRTVLLTYGLFCPCPFYLFKRLKLLKLKNEPRQTN